MVACPRHSWTPTFTFVSVESVRAASRLDVLSLARWLSKAKSYGQSHAGYGSSRLRMTEYWPTPAISQPCSPMACKSSIEFLALKYSHFVGFVPSRMGGATNSTLFLPAYASATNCGAVNIRAAPARNEPRMRDKIGRRVLKAPCLGWFVDVRSLESESRPSP